MPSNPISNQSTSPVQPQTGIQVQTVRKQPKPINLGGVVWTLFWLIPITLVVLKIFFFEQVNVVGGSMEPNYHNDQMLVVETRKQILERGQVVAAYENKDIAKNANYFTRFDPNTRLFLKRVIGLPGEEVEMIGSKVIIYNKQFPRGAVLKEDYIAPEVKRQEDLMRDYYPRVRVPEGNYFLLGDNRRNSIDSRKVGPFPDYSIFGKELLRYLPISEARQFELPNYSFTPLDDQIEQELAEARRTYKPSPAY
jgi:signal peptidase I